MQLEPTEPASNLVAKKILIGPIVKRKEGRSKKDKLKAGSQNNVNWPWSDRTEYRRHMGWNIRNI